MKLYKFIKYFYSILLLWFITLSLYGCSNNSKTSNGTQYNASYLSGNQTIENFYEEVLLCDYSTKLLGSDENRNTNIELACNEIDGTVVEPGDTFSFWEIVEETSKEKGYKEAEALDGNGERIDALGGGICQISSTIYNAVLKKEKSLEVIERHPHSDRVAYVPEGKDASVNYGTADFRFKNNLNVPIKIYTRLENKKVIAEIYELR